MAELVGAFEAFGPTTSTADTPGLDVDSPGSGSAAPPSAPPAEEPAYEVTVAGQVLKVPLSELLKGYSRTSDYTRKTQLLASRSKEWDERESQYQHVLGEAQQILSNRALLEQHLRSLGASPQQATQLADQVAPQPDDVLTRAQAQQLMEERERKLRDELQGQQSAGFQELHLRQLTTEYSGALDAKLDEIATRHPDLPKIPGMDFVIKQAVKQQKPRSVDQALMMMDEAADYFASQVGEVWKGKAAGMPPQPIHGIEPPRGSAPRPPAPAETYDSVSDPRLHDAVLQDLERLIRPR